MRRRGHELVCWIFYCTSDLSLFVAALPTPVGQVSACCASEPSATLQQSPAGALLITSRQAPFAPPCVSSREALLVMGGIKMVMIEKKEEQRRRRQ